MSRSGIFTAGLMGALLLLASVIAGCARLRLPAIDPSGRQIFLPAGNTATTLPSSTTAPQTIPVPSARGLFGLPRPVFTSPATPPACGPGELPAAASVAPAILSPPALAASAPALPPRGPAGSLTLAPMRMVAPVGSEVVLMSGLVGADGRYAPRRKLEWILSQESVGYFVEVGDQYRGFWQKLFHDGPRKLSNNYAIGRTSSRAAVITRGTASPTDDVWLPQGQSWISVTSATEGVSYVTVLSPDATAWDQRRQTAKIYWVDAQWQLPSTAIVQAGQNHPLTTTVTRASDASGVAGWLVRYEIVGQATTGFAPQGDSVIEVATDAAGRATAELLALPQGGTVQVQIQIIRPAMSPGDLPQIVVGQGWASVTWSAPGLVVRTTGPAAAAPDAALAYRLEVSNPGDVAARDVTLSATVPPSIRFLDSNPAAQIFGDRLEWRLGDLAPAATMTVDVNCRALGRSDVRFCARARSADGLQTEHCVDTHIEAPSLALQMTGPETAQVGKTVQFQIEITNRGDAPLQSVNIVDRFDEGLEHADGQQSPIARSLGRLAAGESHRIALTFHIRRAGRLCHRLQVTAAGGESATAQSCLTATAAPPPVGEAMIQLRVAGPLRRAVGEIAEYVIVVTNSGDVALNDLQLTDHYPASQQPELATDGYRHEAGKMTWTIDSLAPGQSETRQVNCRCLTADPAAEHRVTATSTQSASAQERATTEIVPQADPPDDPPTDPLPVSGELRVTVVDQGDPINVGGETTYLIIVKNDRHTSDKNVSLTILIPRGMRFVKLTGPTGTQGVSSDGRTISVAPVAEMRPGESLAPYRLVVAAEQAGKLNLTVKADSLRTATPIEAVEDTTVLVD